MLNKNPVSPTREKGHGNAVSLRVGVDLFGAIAIILTHANHISRRDTALLCPQT